MVSRASRKTRRPCSRTACHHARNCGTRRGSAAPLAARLHEQNDGEGAGTTAAGNNEARRTTGMVQHSPADGLAVEARVHGRGHIEERETD